MATLFVLMLLLALAGMVALERLDTGGIRNHVPSKVRYLGKYKEN